MSPATALEGTSEGKSRASWLKHQRRVESSGTYYLRNTTHQRGGRLFWMLNANMFI
jgi:hypothetical protein